MSRQNNLLHRLVRDENSTTEFLCNLFQIKIFREKFLELFIGHEKNNEFEYEDFDTQTQDESGRPDLIAENKNFKIVIEVKINKDSSGRP